MAVNHHAHEQEHPLAPLVYTSLPTLVDGVTGTPMRMIDGGEIVKGSVSGLNTAPSGDMTVTLYINGIDALDIKIGSGTTYTDFQLATIIHYSAGDTLSLSASGTAGSAGSYVFQTHINRLG
jgi:hypothetical protein